MEAPSGVQGHSFDGVLHPDDEPHHETEIIQDVRRKKQTRKDLLYLSMKGG